jgi:hypothetical protein
MLNLDCSTLSAITARETSAWEIREIERFASGHYKPVPVILDYPSDHYVHLSVAETESDFIAYTPSESYGSADRQVRMKFGRYLKKTFPSLTDAEVQSHVSALKSALAIEAKPARLLFATDEETINKIFETPMYPCGGTDVSCMHGKFDGDAIRPYHVYANSPDVAVAYVVTGDDDIIARSVVSTRYKKWVRAYSIVDGDNDADCRTLRDLLGAAGYENGELTGNRLTKLKTRNVMLPYLDNGGAMVADEGNYWRVVDSNGDYECNHTNGTATRMCEGCGNRQEDCECIYCACCEESYHGGCDTCDSCEACERCVRHDNCRCSRCSECHSLMDDCRCDRCSECSELEDDCDCEKCPKCDSLISECDCPEDSDTEETPVTTTADESATVPDSEPKLVMSYDEIREKLNRIWWYLAYKRDLVDYCAKVIVQNAFDEITRERTATV